MARISTYTIAKPIVAQDKWIGSDSTNFDATRNFTAGDVAIFLNTVAAQNQLLRYKFSIEGVGQRPISSISLLGGSPDSKLFSDVNTLIFSQYAENQGGANLNVSSWYTSPLIGSEVLITQCDDITQWAIYQWNSVSDKGGEAGFFEVGLTLKKSTGSLTKDKDYFISLLSYDTAGSSGDKNEVSAQLDGSSTYTVTHSLNKFPSITVSLGTPSTPTENIECEVTYINVNQVKLEFTNLFTGVAIFN
tara:strand:+ start:430 stop:1170 length:741 start_codon:yes stop_codon:yes gene_type:complete